MHYLPLKELVSTLKNDAIQLVQKKEINHLQIYRVTHKGWEFGDGYTELIHNVCFLIFWILCNCKLVLLFDKLLIDRRFNLKMGWSNFNSSRSSLQSHSLWVTRLPCVHCTVLFRYITVYNLTISDWDDFTCTVLFRNITVYNLTLSDGGYYTCS